uniref:RRM domain-containing protein n=1 Tax=Trichuris muris TaxID=70415 RepID=A0A5S6QNS4_TRIMR
MSSKRPHSESDDLTDPVALKKYQPHSQSSRVLRVSDFPEHAAEADLIDALSQFGAVNYVSLVGSSNALVEFEEQAAAERCIAMTLTTDILVAGKPAFFAYANMRIIPRQGVESDRPSNVLVMYVQNVKYPITTDVIHQICKAIAAVNRIIISRRDGVHALVEFPDIESARAAKQRLNGCDIYANCCTLKIEFAKINRLSVTGNDQDQADYTTTNAGAPQQSELGPPQLQHGASGNDNHVNDNARPPYDVGCPRADGMSVEEYYNRRVEDMLQSSGGTARSAPDEFRPEHDGRLPYYESRPLYTVEPQAPYPDVGMPYDDRSHFVMNRQPYIEPRPAYHDSGTPYDNNMPRYPDEHPPFMNSRGGYMPMMYGNSDMGYRSAYDGPPSRVSDYGYQNDSAVIMIYGLDPTLANCDRLFNLLCLYGNVMKIKFLITRSDTVMAEMSDPKSAQRVIDYLHNAVIFNKTIHVCFSRQPYLNEVRDPPPMHDGSPSYKEYSDSRLQRFTSPHIATKNRVIQPQKYLYFFNAPPNVTEDHLVSLFEEARAPVPVHVKIFSKRGEMVKNSAGILQFEDAIAATEALMFCNHASVDCPGNKSPFIMKLCFAGPANTAIGSEPDDMRVKAGMRFDNMGIDPGAHVFELLGPHTEWQQWRACVRTRERDQSIRTNRKFYRISKLTTVDKADPETGEGWPIDVSHSEEPFCIYGNVPARPCGGPHSSGQPLSTRRPGLNDHPRIPMFGIKLLHDKFRRKQQSKASRKKSAKQAPNGEGAADKQATSVKDKEKDNQAATTVEDPAKESKAEDNVEKPMDKSAPSAQRRGMMPRSQSTRSVD